MGPMPAATHTVEVDLPPGDFYELVTRFEEYPAFVSDVKEARVLAHRGKSWDVWFKASVIIDIEYTLRLTGKPGESLTWDLIESPIMSANTGGWTLVGLPGDRTRATYSVELALTRAVPGTVTRMLVQARLPSMLQDWVKRAREERAKPRPRSRRSRS